MAVDIEVNDSRTGSRQVVRARGPKILIGRDEDNDIVLVSPYISRHHIQLTWNKKDASAVNLGMNPCYLGDQELKKGETVLLEPGVEIMLGEYSLRIKPTHRKRSSANELPWQEAGSEAIAKIHAELVDRLRKRHYELNPNAGEQEKKTVLSELDEIIERTIERSGKDTLNAYCTCALYIRSVLSLGDWATIRSSERVETVRLDAYEREMKPVLDRIKRNIVANTPGDTLNLLHSFEEMKEEILPGPVSKLDLQLQKYAVRVYFHEEIQDIILGFGPIEHYLKRGDITEIMVVGPKRIFVERNGKIERVGRKFISEQNLLDVIERMVAPLGRRVDRSSPMVDGRLESGFRINAVVAPVAVDGPHLTIRKFPEEPFTIDDLIEYKTLDEKTTTFLKACVIGKKNILVAGGTGSGKTTLLNVLAAFIPASERVVTVEDSAELRLLQDHVATLETRPPNVEGVGEITIRDLVRNSLRMRPDRIIVGECRGAEAVDMLQAMNTGHSGSMTTVHSNSAEDAIRRIEAMVLGSHGIPLPAVREQIASALDVVVYIARLAGGERRILQISEILNVDPDTGEMVMVNLFSRTDAPDEDLRSSGRMPSYAPELVSKGLLSMEELFQV